MRHFKRFLNPATKRILAGAVALILAVAFIIGMIMPFFLS